MKKTFQDIIYIFEIVVMFNFSISIIKIIDLQHEIYISRVKSKEITLADEMKYAASLRN